ncbi:MAG TPA: ankyrin repeat domain-containing protein [Thiothrix sp.]|nr:ankyrin repeat domain-containing protein [Thiothrix sp.]
MEHTLKPQSNRSFSTIVITLLMLSPFNSPITYAETLTATSCLAGDAFHKAAAKGNLTTLKRCFEAGVAIDTTEANGWTALHAAAKHGQLNAIEQLLKMGASPFIKDKNGYSALAIAQSVKPSEVQSEVIEHLTQAQQQTSTTTAENQTSVQDEQNKPFTAISVTDPKVLKLTDKIEWELSYYGPSDPFDPGTYQVLKIKQAQQKMVDDGVVYQLVLDLKSGLSSTSDRVLQDYKITVKTNKQGGHLHILQSDL